MHFKDDKLFEQLSEFIGDLIEIREMGDMLTLYSLDSNKDVMVIHKDNDLYTHVIQFKGDNIECAIYGNVNIAIESMNKFEVIIDVERKNTYTD